MQQIVTGTVHGKTIVVDTPLGVSEGQQVEVVVRTVEPLQTCGEGAKNSVGGEADYWTEEDDRIMDQIYRERHNETKRDLGF